MPLFMIPKGNFVTFIAVSTFLVLQILTLVVKASMECKTNVATIEHWPHCKWEFIKLNIGI